MSKTLEQPIPILDISEDCIISKDGDATVAFELFKPELFSLKAEELAVQHTAWVRAMALLPTMTIVHLQNIYTTATWEADNDDPEMKTFLHLCSDRHFYERPYRQHRCYCYLATRQKGCTMKTRSNRSKTITVRCTPEDYTYIRKNFAGTTYKHFSFYARKMLLSQPIEIATRDLSLDTLIDELIGFREQRERLLQHPALSDNEKLRVFDLLMEMKPLLNKIADQCMQMSRCPGPSAKC